MACLQAHVSLGKRKYTFKNRVAAAPKAVRSRLFKYTVNDLVEGTCCVSLQCCKQFTAEDLQKARDQFMKCDNNNADAKAFILAALVDTPDKRKVMVFAVLSF